MGIFCCVCVCVCVYSCHWRAVGRQQHVTGEYVKSAYSQAHPKASELATLRGSPAAWFLDKQRGCNTLQSETQWGIASLIIVNSVLSLLWLIRAHRSDFTIAIQKFHQLWHNELHSVFSPTAQSWRIRKLRAEMCWQGIIYSSPKPSTNLALMWGKRDFLAHCDFNQCFCLGKEKQMGKEETPLDWQPRALDRLQVWLGLCEMGWPTGLASQGLYFLICKVNFQFSTNLV